jgi:FkbM family methyltransferase
MDHLYIDKFKLWRDRGFHPEIIYDIGANKGSWTEMIKNIYPFSEYYLFEANEKNNEFIKEKNYFNVLLSDIDNKEIKFYSHKYCDGGNTGDSVYKELSNGYSEGKYYILLKKTITLDFLIKEFNLPLPDFIKIDVQGAELDILKGASKSLENSTMVLLEISLHQYNEGAPLFAEVITFMNERNFVAIDIIEQHFSYDNYLIQCDILFAKKDTPFHLKKMRV